MSRLTSITHAPTYRYIQAAMLVVLVIAFVTSFQSGSEGAKTLGFPNGFEAALPLVCDVVAGVATFIHGRVRGDAKMRRLAGQFVLIPMLLSWAANSVDHVKNAPANPAWTDWQQGFWIGGVILAAGICPVAVAALLHLSSKYVDFELRQAERTEKRNNTVAAAVAAAAPKTRSRRDDVLPAPAVTAPNPPEFEQDEPVAKPQLRSVPKPGSAAEWAVNNYPCTWEQVVEATGVSRATAFRAVKDAKEASDAVA
jgi:hypothetical protein